MHHALADATDPRPIRTGGPGTAPGRPPGPTRASPRSSSAPPTGRGRAAGWRRPPRSSSGGRADPGPGPAGRARARRRPGQGDRRRVRRARRRSCGRPAGPLDEAGRARVDLLQAQIAYTASHGDTALAAAAGRRPPARTARPRRWPARPTWTRWPRHCPPGASPPAAGVREVAEAVRAAPAPERPSKPTCCSTGSPCCTPTATRPRRRCCAVRSGCSARRAHHGRGAAGRVARGGRRRRPVGRRPLGRAQSPAPRRVCAGGSPQRASARAQQPGHLRSLQRRRGRGGLPGPGEQVDGGGDRR